MLLNKVGFGFVNPIVFQLTLTTTFALVLLTETGAYLDNCGGDIEYLRLKSLDQIIQIRSVFYYPIKSFG